jgi:asparagine synthase (glutamine-hydrolysing)
MVQCLAHRGPDEQDFWVEGPVGLGHTRLSIIDLSETGHQPMRDNHLTIVFNGEVYNFRELQKELDAPGVSYRGHSDTEVILKAFQRWGDGAIVRLNGMFALAIWDSQTSRLLLARDRFGIKPLYYYLTDNAVIFGSEIKSLVASGRIQTRLAHDGLSEYVYYGAALGRKTLYEGVRRLLPGHIMSFERGTVHERAYWKVEDVQPMNMSDDLAAEGVRTRLENAVSRHLVADVPVSIFLSGGIDSSTITAFAARHYSGKLKTYSVGFNFEHGVNELPKAKRVAEMYGTDHHELQLAGAAVPDVIESLVDRHDQPFGDAANIPLYLLARELKGAEKVVLQGDGGDEMFGGYRRYVILTWLRWWKLAARAAPVVDRLAPKHRQYLRLKRILDAVADDDAAIRMARLLAEDPFEPSPLLALNEELRQAVSRHDPFAAYRAADERFRAVDPVQKMLYTDTVVLLPDIFLEKVDRATMTYGIEVRVPFLDAELGEFALGLPASQKIRGMEKKWVLRKALRGIVPDDILDAPKTGFGVPYGAWLRGPLRSFMEDYLLGDSSSAIFDTRMLRTWVDEHLSKKRNHGFRLYKLLNLAVWHRRQARNHSPVDAAANP